MSPKDAIEQDLVLSMHVRLAETLLDPDLGWRVGSSTDIANLRAANCTRTSKL
jgi:hypothetical protein